MEALFLLLTPNVIKVSTRSSRSSDPGVEYQENWVGPLSLRFSPATKSLTTSRSYRLLFPPCGDRILWLISWQLLVSYVEEFLDPDFSPALNPEDQYVL